MIDYKLNENGITFFQNGIIIFDCPLERIENDPKDALIAMDMLDRVWKEQLNIERG